MHSSRDGPRAGPRGESLLCRVKVERAALPLIGALGGCWELRARGNEQGAGLHADTQTIANRAQRGVGGPWTAAACRLHLVPSCPFTAKKKG